MHAQTKTVLSKWRITCPIRIGSKTQEDNPVNNCDSYSTLSIKLKPNLHYPQVIWNKSFIMSVILNMYLL